MTFQLYVKAIKPVNLQEGGKGGGGGVPITHHAEIFYKARITKNFFNQSR